MLKFSQTTADQIRFLLHSVNHSNSDYVLQYLTQFIEYGIEGSTLLLQTCLDYLNQYRIDVKNVALEHVLASVFKYLIDQPNFSTMFCESLRTTEVNEGTLENFSSALQLSVPEKIGIGLALSDSENLETRIVGKNFCMVQIEQLRESSVDNISSEKIQNIILFLQRSEDLFKHLDSFMQMLSLLQLKDDESSFVLSPLLSDELRDTNFLRNVDFFRETGENDFDVILAEMEKEMSMGDIMKELGYGCTVDSSQCKEILSLFLPLNEIAVSKILGSVACTHAGLGDNQSTFSTFRKALGYSISFDLPIQNTWNVDVLVDSINQLAPDTNWISVIERLDHEGFYIPNQEAFSFFMSVYKHACQEPFPLHAICGSVWKNADGQLSFLRQAVSLPPEVFTFAHSVRQLPYTDGASGRKLQLGHANHAWLCLDLLDVLCRLAERGHALSVRSILEYPLQHCPEILLLGMAHINTPYSLLQYEVSVIVFPLIVKNPMGNDMIVHLWQTNPSLVLRGFVDTYNDNPGIMTRILDICRELKILSSVMEMIPSPFSIRLAALAFRKDLVELEKWLSSNLITYKDTFFEECLKFLKEIQASGTQDFSTTPFQHSDAVSTLYGDTTTTFSKVLKAYVGQITSSHLTEEIEKLSVLFMDPNPRVANGGSTESSTDGYADDIEAEANTYFRQMFSGELTVESMVQRLAHFKESSVQREQSIFECMIANLFEEYKFFPKYPDRQLIIAAILFGSVIKQQLVTHLTLGIALRGVLDALRKPADSRMFVFGTKALEQFVERLMEWPQYCNHILQISHLRSTHSELVLFIEKTLARISSGHLDLDHGPSHVASGNMESNGTGIIQTGRIPSSSFQLQHESSFDDRLKASNSLNEVKPLPPAATQTAAPVGDASNNQKLQTAVSAPSMLNSVSPGFVRPLRGPPSTRFGSALSIETLVAAAEKRDAPVEAPAEIQEKVLFIINNISITNIEVKSKEMSEILKEQYYPWFAQYMVMKRASIEPNFHDLYLKFLDKLNSKALNKEIVQATYENCKVLLGSELIKSSSEERSLLKNLGSWLGKLTIGRNQVLRACEIDPKSLIIEAYEKGLMIAVIPFTSKILEPCQSSLAYQPPNPWTMAILGLLAEIYSMPNLKMNLKFDIEVLFKNLGVDLKEIKPTSLLKDHTRELEGNPDFSNKDVGVPQPQIPEVQSGINSPLNQVELPLEVAPSNSGSHSHLLSQITSAQGLIKASPSQSTFSASQHPTATPNIGTHVIINPKLNAGGLHVHFQRVVPHAMDRAIKEIVSGIVQRSVSIATQTTKELVLKDYAMESDDTRIYNAAHLMVASLAGSLAHVTCKEPLRTSILSQLRNSLQGLNITNEYLEQAVLLVTNDNLDLGCAVIEQAATNEAVATIDGEIGPQLSLRRKREGVGATYFDANMYPQGSTGVVPEALRPKPGHLSLSHRVYEDFVRLPLQNQTIQSSHALPVATTASSSSAGLPSTYGSASGQLNTGYSPGPGRKFEAVSRPLDGVMETNSALHLSASSIHVGVGDGVSKHTSENDSVVASFPSTASVPEPHPVDPSDAVKEYGVSSQPPSSPAATERVGNLSELSLSTGVAMERYQIVAQKLETLVTNDARESEIQGVIGEVTDIILRCISRDEAALAVAQKVFKSLYENASNRVHVSAHIAMLTAICDVCKLVFTQLTSWVIYSDEERKFNTEISVGLIHSDLLNLAEYNIHIANLVDGGRNKRATEFATSLVRTLSNEAYEYISELKNVIEALTKVAAKPGSPESLQQLIEIIKNRSANVAALSDVNDVKDDKATVHSPGSREEFCIVESAEPDPPGFRDQVKDVFAQWCCVSDHPAYENNCAHLVMNLRSLGFLMDDVVDRFFRVLTELSVEHCVSSEVINSGTQSAPQQTQNISFLAIDIYAKIVTSVFKMEQGSNKLNLLSKVLAVTVRLIQKDAEEKKSSFNARPYFRLFVNWLLDLGALDPALDAFQGLTAFANAFHALQPLKVPAFSFAWLELVSNRRFMPKMLAGNGQKGWPYIQRLLVDLFQFMEPFLRNAELGVPVHTLYKGTLRVLLVLLHDFPEFLCDYHFTFCDVIPSSCIQMRNIILSAFPRNMRLPDPSTPNLKIDLLAEINQSPRVLSEVDLALKVKQMKTNVDEYLKLRQPGSSFLTELKQKLLLSSTEAASAGTRYNVPLINSLVLYVGMQAIQQLQARTPHSQANQTGPFVFLVGAALDIFQTLTMDLDTEGRYLFLNAIANQLRYPNTHTHYFSFIILYLFAESNQEIIQEQITRVLLERLIANRPHPWGLLITFIELIKNPRYNFWNRSFIRCAPEIEKLFESVSRSCGAKPADESLVSGWVPETAH